jgi:hypothetical protein
VRPVVPGPGGGAPPTGDAEQVQVVGHAGRVSARTLWVPRTVSRLLTSVFVAAQARRPPAIADEHDR